MPISPPPSTVADTEIEVLYADGSPAGFFELDLSRLPHRAEIRYFGLVPEFQGRGLGGFFLSCAIDAAWAHDPEKLTINTNTLDSPAGAAALPEGRLRCGRLVGGRDRRLAVACGAACVETAGPHCRCYLKSPH